MGEFNAIIRSAAHDVMYHAADTDNYINPTVNAAEGDPGHEDCYVDDLLSSWVWMNTGIDQVAAKHEHLLEVALAVAHLALQERYQDGFSYHGERPIRRRVVGIRNPQEDDSILDKQNFDITAYQIQRDPQMPALRASLRALRDDSQDE